MRGKFWGIIGFPLPQGSVTIMFSHDQEYRLSQMTTQWTLLMQAHEGSGEAMAHLLPRYCGAVYRFLLSVVRDELVAEELCQEFAFRFTRGDFRSARPERGRFRDYVKTSVLHLVGEYAKKARQAEKSVPFDSRVYLAQADQPAEQEARFVAEWRQELIDRTWEQLRQEPSEGRPTRYEVLRRKVEFPHLTSAALAEEFSDQFDKPLSAVNIRQMLHRARSRFIELLRAEVARGLPDPTPEAIDTELAALGLLVYCNPGPGDR